MADIEFKDGEYDESSTLKETVEPENDLKEMLVNYVGDKIGSDDGKITVEDIVEVMAKDFPEFLMAIAEENWIRGYHQALVDADEGFKLREEELLSKKCENCECGKCE